MMYTREIVWEPPSLRRRIAKTGALLAAGLTVTAGVVVCLPQHTGCESRAERAKLAVMQLAFEQFPRWRVQHPAAHCPARLADMADRADHSGPFDPWGRAYQYSCDPQLRRTHAPGIEITSAGEDGVFETSDDIRSEP